MTLLRTILFPANSNSKKIANGTLGSIRCFKDIQNLWRKPTAKLECHQLEVLNNGIDTFRPLSLTSCTDSESAIFITDPENSAIYLAEVSIDLSLLNITRTIRLENVVRPINTIYDFNLLFVMDCFKDRAAVHMIDISSDIAVLAKCLVDKNLAFPFGICKSGDRKLYVSDLMNHCVFELNIDTKEFLPAVGVIGESGMDQQHLYC